MTSISPVSPPMPSWKGKAHKNWKCAYPADVRFAIEDGRGRFSFTYGAAANGTTVVDFTATIGSSNNLGTNPNTSVYASGRALVMESGKAEAFPATFPSASGWMGLRQLHRLRHG